MTVNDQPDNDRPGPAMGVALLIPALAGIVGWAWLVAHTIIEGGLS